MTTFRACLVSLVQPKAPGVMIEWPNLEVGAPVEPVESNVGKQLIIFLFQALEALKPSAGSTV